MPYDHTFGGRTRLRPHVFIKCTPENLDMCSRCDHKPEGDYWCCGLEFLCHHCYATEWNNPTKYTRKHLENFKVIIQNNTPISFSKYIVNKYLKHLLKTTVISDTRGTPPPLVLRLALLLSTPLLTSSTLAPPKTL